MTDHPAKYSKGIVEQFDAILDRLLFKHRRFEALVLDPFAGVGGIHKLRPKYRTIGVEIEPEWASTSQYTVVGDATDLPRMWSKYFHAVCTSPTYGNRMADHHEARDASKRRTYRHVLGRALSPNNSGQMQWGLEYQNFHYEAWSEAYRVLQPGGLLLLNISDHIRKHQRVPVCDWHTDTLLKIGFEFIEAHPIGTQRMRFGANRDSRVATEFILVFRKPD